MTATWRANVAFGGSPAGRDGAGAAGVAVGTATEPSQPPTQVVCAAAELLPLQTTWFHVLRLSLSPAPPSLHVTLARHCPRTHAVAAAAVTASYALTCRSYEEFITHSGPVSLLAPVSCSRINGGNEK